MKPNGNRRKITQIFVFFFFKFIRFIELSIVLEIDTTHDLKHRSDRFYLINKSSFFFKTFSAIPKVSENIFSFDGKREKVRANITQHTHIIYTPKILPVK